MGRIKTGWKLDSYMSFMVTLKQTVNFFLKSSTKIEMLENMGIKADAINTSYNFQLQLFVQCFFKIAHVYLLRELEIIEYEIMLCCFTSIIFTRYHEPYRVDSEAV